jgi:small GTP-binding protein
MTPTDDNVVMVLTAPGPAALAVVRLAGPEVLSFLARFFSRPVVPYRSIHGELRDHAGIIDDPVVVYDPAFQVADLSLHASPWIVQSVCDLAAAGGFRLVEPDVRAVNAIGGLDADIRMAWPLVRTSLAARILSSQARAWRDMVVETKPEFQRKRMSDDRTLFRLFQPPRVAIVGAANAGKSTLANAMFGTERSIVSPVAGTTRDWVGEEANLGGLIVQLIDTPGRRRDADLIEAEAFQIAGRAIADADLTIHLLDGEQPAEIPMLTDAGHQLLLVNKSDRLHSSWQGTSIERMSARSSADVERLIVRLRDELLDECADVVRPRCWTPTQVECLQDERRLRAYVGAEP